MKRITWLLFVLLALMFSCSNSKDEAVIKGNIQGLNKQEILLSEIEVHEITPVDSAKTNADGKFRFAHEPESEGLYLLKLPEEKQIVLVLTPGDKISIDGNAGSFSSIKIDGSEESQTYLDYQHQSERNREFIDSVAGLIRNSRNSAYTINIDRERSLIDSVFEQQKEMAHDYIREHPASLTSLIVLNQPFGSTPLFDEEEDFAFFAKIDSALMKRIPGNKHSRDHHLRTEDILQRKQEKKLAEERMQEGNIIPDISLPDSSGQEISLHSLQGNKVLVYFWSAFNGKSRQINSKLKEFYKSRNKDIKIYAVSLDQNPDIWKAAIKLDKLHWINVNESAGIYSPLLKLYGLPSDLPYFIVLDEDSSILYKGKDYAKAIQFLN